MFEFIRVAEIGSVTELELRAQLIQLYQNLPAYSVKPSSTSRNEARYYTIKGCFVKVHSCSSNDEPEIRGLLREGRVGLLANQLKNPYLTTTIGYYKWLHPDQRQVDIGIVTELVLGTSLGFMLTNLQLSAQVIRKLFQLVLLGLGSLAGTETFTHYDPGLFNFIASKHETKQTYHLELGEYTYSVTTRWQLKLIDFERSFVAGIDSEYCPCLGDSGITPGVYDHFFDFAWIYENISKIFTDIHPISALLVRNGFNVNDHPRYQMRGYPLIVQSLASLVPEMTYALTDGEVIAVPWAAVPVESTGPIAPDSESGAGSKPAPMISTRFIKSPRMTVPEFRSFCHQKMLELAQTYGKELDLTRVHDRRYINELFQNDIPIAWKAIPECNQILGELLAQAKLEYVGYYTDDLAGLFEIYWDTLSNSRIRNRYNPF